jgi:type IV pilus assembly protein PilM
VRKRYALGLDVGAHAIKWAQFGEVNGRIELIELGYEPFTPGHAGSSPHLAAADHLKAWANARRFKGPTNLTLRLEHTSLRTIKLPPLPEQELGQAVRWQVEKELPSHLRYEDLCVDYLPISAYSPSREQHYLLVTTPRTYVDAAVASLKGTGLQISAVDIDPLAIETCLMRLYPERAQETALLLHIGTQRASMSILAKGSLAFSRANLISGNSLTQAIADKLHVPAAGAEQFKQEYGILDLVDPEAGDESSPRKTVAQALASCMENLMVDFMHAFMGFSHQGTQSQIKSFDRVYLCGGATQLPGLVEWLHRRIEVPVELINPFAGRALPDTASLPVPIERLYPQLIVAVGLAMRELVDKNR